MTSRTVMLRGVAFLALGASIATWPGSRSLARLPEPIVRADEVEDEKAIRDADSAFINAYNKGDAKALAALFAEDTVVVEADGRRLVGRDQVEKDLADLFETEKGLKIAVEVESIRFLSKDVAKEDGRTIVTPLSGAPVSQLYSVLYVKKDGRWLIFSVREEDDPLVAPRDRLKDLDWMIGDGLDEGSDSEVRVHCERSEDGHFLIRTYSIIRAGKPEMTVTQRVGWDPVGRHFRSWEFDSEGGFGQGKWSRAGESWVVKHEGTRPEGTTASATNLTTLIRPDQVRTVSTDRVIGEHAIPGEESMVLVRVPPKPRVAPNVPTPNTPRNPR